MGLFDDAIKIGNTIRAGLPRPQEDDDKVSDALTTLGFPVQAQGDKPFGQIERFQEREGLKVDAIVMPQGPTLAKINERLAERRMRAENNPLAAPEPWAPARPAPAPKPAEPAAPPPLAPRAVATARPFAPEPPLRPTVHRDPIAPPTGPMPPNTATPKMLVPPRVLQDAAGAISRMFRRDSPPEMPDPVRSPPGMRGRQGPEPYRIPPGVDPNDPLRVTDPVAFWRGRTARVEFEHDRPVRAVLIHDGQGRIVLALRSDRPSAVLEEHDGSANGPVVIGRNHDDRGRYEQYLPPQGSGREPNQPQVRPGEQQNSADRDRQNFSNQMGRVRIRYPSGLILGAADQETGREIWTTHPGGIIIDAFDAERIGLGRWLERRPREDFIPPEWMNHIEFMTRTIPLPFERPADYRRRVLEEVASYAAREIGDRHYDRSPAADEQRFLRRLWQPNPVEPSPDR